MPGCLYNLPAGVAQKLDGSYSDVGSEMGKGDPGMEDIYHWDPVTGPRVVFKGPTGTAG